MGTCHLCGEEKKLTFEHVPPKKAFNATKIRLIRYCDLLEHRRGTWQQRGAGKFTLCEECNNLTGTWYAPAYINFASTILEKYPNINEIDTSVQIEIKTFPLRLLKQILTMFFSLNGSGFQLRNQKLKQFVLHKESNSIPSDYFILIFLYSENLPYKTGVMAELNDRTSSTYSLFSFFPITLALCFDNVPNWGRQAPEISDFSRCNYYEEKNVVINLSKLI